MVVAVAGEDTAVPGVAETVLPDSSNSNWVSRAHSSPRIVSSSTSPESVGVVEKVLQGRKREKEEMGMKCQKRGSCRC